MTRLREEECYYLSTLIRDCLDEAAHLVRKATARPQPDPDLRRQQGHCPAGPGRGPRHPHRSPRLRPGRHRLPVPGSQRPAAPIEATPPRSDPLNSSAGPGRRPSPGPASQSNPLPRERTGDLWHAQRYQRHARWQGHCSVASGSSTTSRSAPTAGPSTSPATRSQTGDGLTETALTCRACGTAWPLACVTDWAAQP